MAVFGFCADVCGADAGKHVVEHHPEVINRSRSQIRHKYTVPSHLSGTVSSVATEGAETWAARPQLDFGIRHLRSVWRFGAVAKLVIVAPQTMKLLSKQGPRTKGDRDGMSNVSVTLLHFYMEFAHFPSESRERDGKLFIFKYMAVRSSDGISEALASTSSDKFRQFCSCTVKWRRRLPMHIIQHFTFVYSAQDSAEQMPS